MHRGAVRQPTLSFASPLVASVSASVTALVFVLLCASCEHHPQDPHPNKCIVDGYCDYTNGESSESCFEDCNAICSPSTMGGTPHEFLVSELYLPDTSPAGKENGLDMNGDGIIDNKLGILLSLVGGQFPDIDLNEHLNVEIAAGRLLLVVRLLVDQLENDDAMLVQLLHAVVAGDATPLFDGNDQVALDPEAPQDLYLCGRILNGILEAGPVYLPFSVSIPELGPLDLVLERAQIIGPITPDGLENVMVGGGLSGQEIDTHLFPRVLEWMQGELAAAPTGPLATSILDNYDDHCTTAAAPTCNPTSWDCAPDGEISLDEVRCNDILGNLLLPGLDVDGDGVKDLVPIGFRIVSAVPVTVIASP